MILGVVHFEMCGRLRSIPTAAHPRQIAATIVCPIS